MIFRLGAHRGIQLPTSHRTLRVHEDGIAQLCAIQEKSTYFLILIPRLPPRGIDSQKEKALPESGSALVVNQGRTYRAQSARVSLKIGKRMSGRPQE